MIEKLKKHKYSDPFRYPVDYVSLKIPDYPNIIKEPMDLSTVEKKLKEHLYSSFSEFDSDIKKIWNNALIYNPPQSQIHGMTQEIKGYYFRIANEDQENEKYTKMQKRTLTMEKKMNSLQSKGGSRHGKSSYRGQTVEHPLTYQEKKNLSTMIRSLETEHLLGVWEIVSEGNDQIKDNEIEFDIETLPVKKARELEKYVQSKLELMKKNKKLKATKPEPPQVRPATIPVVKPEEPQPVQERPVQGQPVPQPVTNTSKTLYNIYFLIKAPTPNTTSNQVKMNWTTNEYNSKADNENKKKDNLGMANSDSSFISSLDDSDVN